MPLRGGCICRPGMEQEMSGPARPGTTLDHLHSAALQPMAAPEGDKGVHGAWQLGGSCAHATGTHLGGGCLLQWHW